MTKKLCNDAGEVPFCKGIADPNYTMHFPELGPDQDLYWCSVCGPSAHELDKRLKEAMEEDPTLMKRLHDAIKKEESKT